MEQQKHICKNCNNEFVGKYCNLCGEKVFTIQDKKVVHLLEEVFHFVTHFEGSFLTTIKTVFTNPGKFSLDYCNGIRKKYFKPVSLFLFFVVLYLLFPRFQGLNMRLDTYATEQYGFTWIAVPLIKEKMKSKNIDYKQLAVKYDSKSASISKIGLFLIIPLAASILLLLFYRQYYYFFDHAIISLELSSIYIGLHFLFIPFVSFVAESINHDWVRFFYDDNYWLAIFTLLIDLIIVINAFKTFYKQNWFWTSLKAIIYIIGFGEVVIYLYRLVVLYFTIFIS
ncbi:MAG: DUF3667 domain-containing protein [Sphingobacteriia bacterium]|jgi:hypothetical protein